MKKDWNARLEEITQTDKAIWATGRAFAGIDEAGRGPLCGPVAAACVVMPPEPLLLYVDDSKKLTEKRREELYDKIMQTAVYAKVILASPEEIDRVNILNATKNAMAMAAKDMNPWENILRMPSRKKYRKSCFICYTSYVPTPSPLTCP